MWMMKDVDGGCGQVVKDVKKERWEVKGRLKSEGCKVWMQVEDTRVVGEVGGSGR